MPAYSVPELQHLDLSGPVSNILQARRQQYEQQREGQQDAMLAERQGWLRTNQQNELSDRALKLKQAEEDRKHLLQTRKLETDEKLTDYGRNLLAGIDPDTEGDEAYNEQVFQAADSFGKAMLDAGYTPEFVESHVKRIMTSGATSREGVRMIQQKLKLRGEDYTLGPGQMRIAGGTRPRGLPVSGGAPSRPDAPVGPTAPEGTSGQATPGAGGQPAALPPNVLAYNPTPEKDEATAALREFEMVTGINQSLRGTDYYESKYKEFLRSKKEATHITVNAPGMGKDFRSELYMRKEFTALPEVKGFVTIEQQMGRLDKAMEANQRGGSKVAVDQALITILNKMLDPSSVVRESEYARTPADMGMLNRLQGKLDKLSTGGAGLTDEERTAIYSMSKNFYEVAKEQYGEQVGYYRDMATRYGFNPDNIVRLGGKGVNKPGDNGGGGAKNKVWPVLYNGKTYNIPNDGKAYSTPDGTQWRYDPDTGELQRKAPTKRRR